MSYLIDMGTITYSIKGSKSVQDNFLKNENIPKSISIISYGELLFSAKKSQNIEKNTAVVLRIKELFPVINIDKAIIEIFSELKADSHKTGNIIDDFDLLIASTDLTMNSILVTNNEKHFSKVKGLKIENWAK
ncbi:MAG: PIN domain-containing protein [Spirochaetes bacterium]|nr:PIN domain-containing protein [Spirochaetota bacterium]